MSKIVCVVPSIRSERMAEFRKAWAPLFERHGVTLITVWDGEKPRVTAYPFGADCIDFLNWNQFDGHRDLFCRHTDAVRNLGFVYAASLSEKFKPDYILTLDDDVHPPAGSDPIQEHLDVLARRVPISWMNTAMDGGLCSWPKENKVIRGQLEIEPIPYLRGFPYGIRDEAPVMVSHGVWVNVPDFDGKTQLELTNDGQNPERLPYSLPYFRGPVPKGTYFSFCGMNVMVRKEALPYLYFAPMGPDTGVEGLNRFADIWCGLLLKRAADANNFAIYTGASTVIHTRASDPFKNVEQERLGIEWNEWMWQEVSGSRIANATDEFRKYLQSYRNKAARFRDLIRKLQGAS